MSRVPSIRVDCSQCKKAFWVKLKKGTIPSAIVACPNCAYAWDLGQHASDAIVQRSYMWDELITRIGLIFQPGKKSLVVPDESAEQFREANMSSDSIEHWRPDSLVVQVEPPEDEPDEVIPYPVQDESEEIIAPPAPDEPVDEAEAFLESQQMLQPPRLGSGPPKLELPKLRPVSFQKSSLHDGKDDT